MTFSVTENCLARVRHPLCSPPSVPFRVVFRVLSSPFEATFPLFEFSVACSSSVDDELRLLSVPCPSPKSLFSSRRVLTPFFHPLCTGPAPRTRPAAFPSSFFFTNSPIYSFAPPLSHSGTQAIREFSSISLFLSSCFVPFNAPRFFLLCEIIKLSPDAIPLDL